MTDSIQIRLRRGLGVLLALAWALFAVAPAWAQTTAKPKHVRIDLLAEKRSVAPGETIWIALRQDIDKGWHTYWVNPGDSGEPTTITWVMPQGFKASDIHWPLPEAIPVGPLTNYGYSNEVVLPVRLTVPNDAKAGPVEIKADAVWLVCADICIPENGSATLSLDVVAPGTRTPEGPDAARLAAARRLLPEASPWSARFTGTDEEIRLAILGAKEIEAAKGKVTFFPLQWGAVSHSAAQSASFRAGDLVMTLKRGDEKKLPEKLEGVLVVEQGSGAETVRQGFTQVAVRGIVEPVVPASGANPARGASGGSSSGAGVGADIGFATALLFALLGGMILNLMPCVFPVLSLKALALSKGEAAAHQRAHGLSYLAGVLVSFALLALALIVLRRTGAALGWGFQFQSPAFVLLLAGLFFGLGLSLSGVFALGGSMAGAGDRLTRSAGVGGSFFTGALATIAATPCTAPFMGAAVGFALTAPSAAMFAVLMAMGLGFALPMTALAFSPRLLARLPKPGAWMETFKQVLAFPLYATAAWLVWVLSLQSGSDGVVAAMALAVGLAFAAWLAGGASTSGALRRWAALAVFAAVAAGALRLLPATTATGLAQTSAQTSVQTSSQTANAIEERLGAIAFSTDRIATLQAEGRTVFVNMTAAWCISCKVNERLALSSDQIAAAFAANKVAYVKGDWTKQDERITEFLRSFGRAGVPLYLVYPPRAGAEPRVLPQLLTESIVLDAIRSASRTAQRN